MPAQTQANYDISSSAIIVPKTGLIHPRDRGDRAWIRTNGNKKYSLLISSTHIRRRIAELAREIVRATRKKNEINFLIVLKGAAFFGCRLAQEIFRAGGPEVIIHFVSASSYGKSTCSAGHCRISGNLSMLRGRDVMVIEDICDTGLTLDRIKRRLLKKEQASSVKTCVLLDKPGRRRARWQGKPRADFIGFQIPKSFVAGFGLDYAEKYRELPFIIGIRKS